MLASLKGLIDSIDPLNGQKDNMQKDSFLSSFGKTNYLERCARLLINGLALTLLCALVSLPAFAADTVAISPDITSLLPAAIAISFAFLLRQVIPAIFAGLWAGAVLTHGISQWVCGMACWIASAFTS